MRKPRPEIPSPLWWFLLCVFLAVTWFVAGALIIRGARHPTPASSEPSRPAGKQAG